jgi:hypothetical protein
MSDYVLWESYGYSSNRGADHDRWKSTIQKSRKYSQDARKAKKILALSYPEDVAQALYSFAIARIFGFVWTANLGENQQDTTQPGGHFGAFLPQMPLQLGESARAKRGYLVGPVLHRRFQHGEAFANTGSMPAKIVVPAGVTLYLGSQVRPIIRTTQVVLPASTAAVWIVSSR